MAATFVTVTNLTATTITVAGDEGKPVVTLGHAAGANTATINMGDLLGNYDLCTKLAAWITSGKVSVTRGALTLPAADLTAYAQGSDMSRVDYDSDDDSIVDASESIAFSSVTATTALAVGDSFLIYDLSETATRKVTVPVAMDVSVLTAVDAAAKDDSTLIYDLSAGAIPKARKTSVEDLLNPLKLTDAAAVASGDLVILHDLTAPTIASKTTVEKLLNPVNLTAAAAVASGDIVILHDLTAPTIASQTTVEKLLNPVNLTAAAAVAKDDIVIIHDLTAPTIASSTTVSALLNPIALDAATVVEDADVVLIGDASDSLAKKMTVANLFARKVFQATDLQAVAADLTTVTFIAPAAGTIKGALCKAGTGAAAGENMTVDVTINGASCLSAVMDMTNAVGTNVVTGAINAAADDFVAGDVIRVVRDYTAGGGPTPMANTVVSVWANIALS